MAIADLHGHLDLFNDLLGQIDREYPGCAVILLGDYVDNGTQIPQLLDRLVELRQERESCLIAIMGNHDLACLRSIGWDGAAPDEEWYERWETRYWNARLGTAPAYGASSGAELSRRMPKAHRDFLQSLPWFHETDEHFFVHAGLKPEKIAPQRRELASRQPLGGLRIHPQLREKKLATVDWNDWGKVVVSAHTKKPGDPHFLTDRRITLSAEVDQTGTLYAIELWSRRILRAS